ncbi:MAG: cysteine desulfurase, partial [Chryseolinea sp.]
MSTSIDNSGLPDVKLLEKLANEYFSNYNSDGIKSAQGSPSSSPEVKPVDEVGVDVEKPRTSLNDPHLASRRSVPASEGGSGISPAIGDQVNKFGASNPQTSLPDTRTTTHGVVPGSVAGSGISPSVTEHGKSFNINNPQNSHQDPHLNNPGVVPASLAGSGMSPEGIQPSGENSGYGSRQTPGPYMMPHVVPPSIPGLGISPTGFQRPYQAGYEQNNFSPVLPFATEHSFETDLKHALNKMYNTVPESGLPQPGTFSSDPSFYFISAPNQFAFPGTAGNHVQQYLSLKEKHGLSSPPFDVNVVKKDFPILQEKVNGKSLVWFDNAATTQKPRQVIDRISYFYEHENSNIHRAAHELAARATDAYEGARKKVQEFLHASSPNEIIFVRGATEAINLIAKSWGDQFLKSGDEIIISHLEHHANIVPWQQLAARKGLVIKVIPVDETGQILLDEYAKLLGPKTKLVSVTQVSNALGTVTPVKQITDMAHQAGAKVLIDGAQSVSHIPVNVQFLDCDWFVFSGHKVFGPTGIGVVYGKEALLNETQPWQGGGNMIVDVTFEHTKYHNAPSRFEAGTGNIADAVG